MILGIAPSHLIKLEKGDLSQISLGIIAKLIEFDRDIDLNYVLGHSNESIIPHIEDFQEVMANQASDIKSKNEQIAKLKRENRIHLDLNNTLRLVVNDLKEQAKKEDEE